MQQQLSVLTLGLADLARSRRFYCVGFRWTPCFRTRTRLLWWTASSSAPRLPAHWKPTCTSAGADGRVLLARNVATADEVRVCWTACLCSVVVSCARDPPPPGGSAATFRSRRSQWEIPGTRPGPSAPKAMSGFRRPEVFSRVRPRLRRLPPPSFNGLRKTMEAAAGSASSAEGNPGSSSALQRSLS